ncbi:amino acid transporter [Neocallimastix lanati (nom. inval.)]|jgi:amino acid transporter|nr:amino acid transporter [Neocallimastix sp. JGI-2020a]
MSYNNSPNVYSSQDLYGDQDDEIGLLNNVLNDEIDEDSYSNGFDFEIHSIPLSLSQVKQTNQEVERHVTLFQGVNLIIGLMIGSGIFASPGPVLQYSGSVGASLLIWLIAGLLALTGALCYAELGTMIPASGGEHPYLALAYGKMVSFLFSWTAILVQKPGSLSIICVVFADYLCKILFNDDQISNFMSKLMAVLCLVILTIINCLSSKLSRWIQNIFTMLKLVALSVIGIIGFIVLITGPMTDNFNDIFKGSSKNPGTYALALYSALWAYDGWNNLNLVTGELKNPKKNLPRALKIGCFSVIASYIVANVAYYAVLTAEVAKTSKTIVSDFGRALFGPFIGHLLILTVILSTFGAANASMYTGSRLIQVTASQGQLPKTFAKISSHFDTPVNATILQTIFSIFYVITGSYNTLVNLYSTSTWIFYGLCVLGLIILRFTQPHMERPYRVWFTTPLIFVSVVIFLVFFSFMDATVESILGVLFVITGIPVYIMMEKKMFRKGLDYLKYKWNKRNYHAQSSEFMPMTELTG